jgi:tetratricopeptide (TPR) repeat protein
MDPKLSAARDALRELGEISRLISEGDAANRRRQWPEAALAYAQALAIDPELAAIWVQYGHALKEQGLLDAAETAYRTAIGHMPQPDGDIHLQIGHLLKLRGMLPEAREAYLACLGVEPDNPHAKREIAAMLGRRVSRLPAIAPPSGAGGRPYTEVPLAALPGERMRISHQHGLACFTAEGPDPQLELAPDGPGWPLPPGTYGLLFEVADGRGFEGAPMPAARSTDTVVCLHIFYEDLIEEFAAVIAQAQQRLPLDVIVSLPEAWPLAALERLIAALRPVHILVCRNRGRDVAPFLAALEVVQARGYRHGCKIHSKKSTHLGRGEAWRRALLEGLLGPAALTRLEEGFFADARIGMAGMGEAWLSLAERQNIVHCESRMGEIGALLSLEDAPMRGFFAGTMFWFRPEALTVCARLSGHEIFEPELGQVDGMAAHALERLFAVMVEAAGFTVLKLSLP